MACCAGGICKASTITIAAAGSTAQITVDASEDVDEPALVERLRVIGLHGLVRAVREHDHVGGAAAQVNVNLGVGSGTHGDVRRKIPQAALCSVGKEIEFELSRYFTNSA